MTRLRSLLIAMMMALALSGLLPGGAGASVAHAQGAGAAWRPDAEDQWLFELRTERYLVGDGVRGYAGAGRVCVDFGDMIRALDLPIRIDTQLRRATGWVFDERHTLLIDREAGTVAVAGRSQPLAVNDIIDTAEGWCVAPDVLARWLGVNLRADTGNSVLHLSSDTPMPFELAAQRRARASAIRPQAAFNLATLPQARRPYAMWQTPSVDVVASAGYIRDAHSGTHDAEARYELYASGEALGASFDARLSSDNSARPQSLRVRAYRSDNEGGLLGPLHATHAAIGDISSISTPTAAQPVNGRGAVVTNRPLDLPDSFDRTTFRGDLPAGWEAELYRNGELLGFAEPDGAGRYEFTDVRLLYGLNRFEVVLYGPQGQVRREIRNIPVGMDAIPPGKTIYWAGILQEGADLLTLRRDRRPFPRGWRGSMGVERGLNRRTSIGLWATSLTIEDERHSFAEATLRRSIGTTLAEFTGTVAANGGYAGRLLWLGQLGQGYFQVESLNARGGFRSDRVGLGVTGLHSLSFDHTIKLAGAILPVHVEGRYRTRIDGINRVETTARLSSSWRNLSLTGQIDWRRYTGARGSGGGAASDEVIATMLANARFGRLRVRGEAAVGLSGANVDNHVAIVGEWTQDERTDWRLELGYESAASRARAGVGYTRRFDRLALTGFGEVASDGSVAGGISLSFGFGPDPRNGGVRFSRDRLASSGQALATVFFDDDGDGQRGAGEALANGVVLTAGNAMADTPTGVDGQAIVDSLTPFRPVMIGIDENSLGNPLVRPAVAGVVVTPRPGVATRVLIPLVSAGEVEGTLMRAGGNGIEGVDLELVDARGTVRATTRSDFDGFFLFESVPYGSYRLRVSTLAAQAIQVDPALGVVSLDRQTPRARLGVLTLAARASIARSDGSPPGEAGAQIGSMMEGGRGSAPAGSALGGAGAGSARP